MGFGIPGLLPLDAAHDSVQISTIFKSVAVTRNLFAWPTDTASLHHITAWAVWQVAVFPLCSQAWQCHPAKRGSVTLPLVAAVSHRQSKACPMKRRRPPKVPGAQTRPPQFMLGSVAVSLPKLPVALVYVMCLKSLQLLTALINLECPVLRCLYKSMQVLEDLEAAWKSLGVLRGP